MARTRLYPPSVDPGFPKLPPTPDGWTRRTFADVLEVVERPTKLSPDATYRLLTAKRSRGGIALRGELLGREILTKTQFEAKAGDFLISRRQIIHGACGVVPRELDGAVVSNEYSTLRTRPSLLMDFLRHYSHTPYFQRTCFHSSHGVDVEKMIFKINEWLAREVIVPPLSEQRRIATILSSVDAAIDATCAVIDQLGVVKNAMMAELLTRGLPGRHTRFKETEIGEVPEAWDVVPLRSVGRVCTGNTPPTSNAELWGPGYPFVTPGDLSETRLVRTAERSVTTAGIEKSRPVPPRSVLVTCIGSSIGKVGMSTKTCCTNQQINSIVCADAWDAEYVFYAVVAAKPRILERASTTAVPIINKGSFEQVLIPCPPAAEQTAIATGLSAVEDCRDANVADVAGLQRVKAALMSVLLTGEVRVTPDDEAAA
jgi:type I restriction enzyme S subunit